jgi:hypothetical protein
MDNLEWNCWNLVLIRSVKFIFDLLFLFGFFFRFILYVLQNYNTNFSKSCFLLQIYIFYLTFPHMRKYENAFYNIKIVNNS